MARREAPNSYGSIPFLVGSADTFNFNEHAGDGGSDLSIVEIFIGGPAPPLSPLARARQEGHTRQKTPSTARATPSPTISPRPPASTCQAPTTLNKWFFDHYRYVLASYMLVGITLSTYSRSALPLASVGMVADSVRAQDLSKWTVKTAEDPESEAQTTLDGSCPVTRGLNGTIIQEMEKNGSLPASASVLVGLATLTLDTRIKLQVQKGELIDWNPTQLGAIYAGHCIGAIFLGVPMSRIGEIYGTKWIIFVSTLAASIHGFLLPIAARSSFSLMMLFEIVLGGMSVSIDLVVYTLLSHWLCPVELAFSVALVFSCPSMSGLLTNFANGYILSQGISWQWCFYLPGILCSVWVAFWVLLGSSRLATSRFVSSQEMYYVAMQNKDLATTHQLRTDHHRRMGAPWLALAKDPTIWALVLNKFTLKWCATVVGSLFPTYLNNVLHAPVVLNGMIGGIGSLVSLVACFTIGYLCKSHIIKRPFNLSITTVRKIFQIASNLIMAGGIFIMTQYDCDLLVTLLCYIGVIIGYNFVVAGSFQLPLDMSKEYCGLIFSIGNTLAIGQAIGTPISGIVLNYGPSDRYIWRIVWYIIVGQLIFASFIWLLFVDATPRNYNTNNKESDQTRDEEMKLNKGYRSLCEDSDPESWTYDQQ